MIRTSRRPELLILLAGVLLRLSMALSFDVRHGYDFPAHWAYVEYVALHWTAPPPDLNAATYYPPFYYFIAAGLLRFGLGAQAIGGFSAVCGALRLVLIYVGLGQHLPERPLARAVGLTLAACIPASLHLDGMVYGEALNNLLATGALLLVPRMYGPGPRWRSALLLGLILGLELWTKVSALVLVSAFGVAAGVELVRERDGGPRARVLRAAPWLLTLALTFSFSAGYFADSYRYSGQLLMTSFEAGQPDYMAQMKTVSYFARRRPRFFVGWSTAPYSFPYWPAGSESRERATFFPVLIASSFVDYYNFGFCPPPGPGDPLIPANAQNGRPGVRPIGFGLSIASLLGGTLLALATVIAWGTVLAQVWRRREYERLALLLVPMVAVLGQLHFATKYPFDGLGMIKGAYLQFAAPPLYALFGVAVDWAWHRPRFRALAFVLLAGLALVLSYTLYCRVFVPLSD